MRLFVYLKTSGPALALALAAALSAGPAQGADNNWTGDGGLDYANTDNWFFGTPSVTFDDIAVIDNGDAVILDSNPSSDPAGLRVVNGSSLEIQSGGTLDAMVGTGGEVPSPPGDVSSNATGSLIVRSGGTLTAAGSATLAGNTRMVGTSAVFSAGSFSLGGSHTLTAEITNSSSHSALSTTGSANLGGALALEFNGVNPVAGDSWTVVDASSVSGAFASVMTNTTLPLGQTFFVNTSAGGNGQLVTASIGNQLVLSINVVTGATSIDNLSTTATEDINGYSIAAASPTLDPGGWTSFQDDGQSNWEEANPAANHLGELNFTDSRVVGTEESIDLGSAYAPPSVFGVPPEPVSFEYRLAAGETRDGAVNFTGGNTLVLQVDPTSGQSQIINPSAFDVNVNGYSIVSLAGSLDTVAWTPLADSDADWEEANPASNHVGELNFSGSDLITKLEAGAPIALGALFTGGEQDLTFEFRVVGGAALPGDFTGDGNVNGDDFLAWQRGESPGGVVAADLQLFEEHYGETGGAGGGAGGTYAGVVEYVSLNGASAAAGAVPEPASLAMLLSIGLAAAVRRTRLIR